MKFLAVASLFLSCLPAFSAPDGGKRNCRIIFPDRPHDAPAEVYLFDGKASRKVELPSMNLSEVIHLPPGDLELGLTAAPVDKPGQLPPEAPTTKIAASIRDFYLVVVSDPDNKFLPLRMLSVDPNDKRPEPGQTLWINLSKHAISGTLGNESLDIPASARVLAKVPLNANGYLKAEFRYQPQSGGEFLPLMNKSWWFDIKSGNLGFIIDSGGRMPGIFTFRDFRDP
jgi:hypothetical protein